MKEKNIWFCALAIGDSFHFSHGGLKGRKSGPRRATLYTEDGQYLGEQTFKRYECVLVWD